MRERISSDWCSYLRDRGVPFDVHVVERSVASVILSVASKEQADLIVGSRRHPDRVLHHQATLATHLDHRASVPVLCVPSSWRAAS
ncbi:MAG: universal stress protein [Actinomycetota bacterium]|nr:universal stress protein [Actinomycetota bacterium]